MFLLLSPAVLAAAPVSGIQVVPYAQPIPFLDGPEASVVLALGRPLDCTVEAFLDRTGEVRSAVALDPCPAPLRPVLEETVWNWGFHTPLFAGRAVSAVHEVRFQVAAARVFVDRPPSADRAVVYAAPLAIPLWNLERSYARAAEHWLDRQGGSGLHCVLDLRVDGDTRRATAMEVVACPEEVARAVFARARWQGFRILGGQEGEMVFRLDIEHQGGGGAVAVRW